MARKPKEKPLAEKALPEKNKEKTAAEAQPPCPAPRECGLKKEFLKSKNICRVTFRLPKVAAPNAKSVSLVGDFNEWNIRATPMKKMKNGDYSVTVDLAPGREYQFRYLIDDSKWENDWNADKYVRSPFGGCDNSVVMATSA